MLDQLAHHPDPYPAYAQLRERGVRRGEDGRWVVARVADVAAVLASPQVAVGFRPGPNDPDGRVQARMARFSDGEDHARRRAIAVARLARIDPARLRLRARELALSVRGQVGTEGGSWSIDVMARLARPVPVAVLAEALGASPGDAEAASIATRDLALALAPPVGTPPADPLGPATCLAALIDGTESRPSLGHPVPGTVPSHPADRAGPHPFGAERPKRSPRTQPTDGGLSEEEVNVLGLLFQAVDATAGLIGNAVVAADRFGAADAAELVAETTRFDPPVQLTNRITTGPLTLGGVTIPAGERIVVLLAAANRDPDRYERPDQFDPSRRDEALTFGTGPRPCPGAAHALALATGVLDALLDAGLTLAEPAVTYEPRPNLRIPARLSMRGN